MPYKSAKQRNFFKLCAHNPGKAHGKCPSKAAIRKFERHGRKKR